MYDRGIRLPFDNTWNSMKRVSKYEMLIMFKLNHKGLSQVLHLGKRDEFETCLNMTLDDPNNVQMYVQLLLYKSC